MKCLRLTKHYIITPKQFTQNDDVIFSKLLDDLHRAITIENLINVYPIYDYKHSVIDNRIRRELINKFNLDKDFVYLSIDDIKDVNNNIVIKLVENINDKRVVDFISKLTMYYKDVFIVNFIYDNPIDDIFYVICKNKLDDTPLTLTISEYDYITNIDNNRNDIFVFLYTCYYYWYHLAMLANQTAREIHFKRLKDVSKEPESTTDSIK